MCKRWELLDPYQQYDQVVNLRASFPSWNLLNEVGNLAIGRIWTL